jgi:hypothetical protein
MGISRISLFHFSSFHLLMAIDRVTPSLAGIFRRNLSREILALQVFV